jgi:ribonuclease J
MPKNRLRIIPLGGLGEIGKNCMLVEFQDEIVMIDAGVMFPENDMLGVDLVIPDITYLQDKVDMIRGLVITHGHEDHIGALPYLLPRLGMPPVYATRLTQGLIAIKLKEHRLLDKTHLNTIQAGDTINVGPFQIEFFHVSHSIPDGVGLALHTPIGTVVHSGDFKFDHTPVDGRLTDFARLAGLGQQGVLVLLSDSTNADSPGYTPSEKVVGEMFDHVFARAAKRIIVATFASNISRIQQIVDAALRYDRHVGIVGRSMVENVRMARDLGYLDVPEGVLLRLDELNRLPPDQVVIVTTGSQGEPTSALSRMANRDYQPLPIVPGDTVVISATPIPGNEESVNHTIDNLFRLGADVLYNDIMDVHVSGHAAQEEQKLMLNLVQPRYFVPIHGEYRHLRLHARLAEAVGVEPDNIFVLEDGQIAEFAPGMGRLAGEVPADYVFVDGLGVGDVGDVVLRDRQALSQDGVVIATITVDKKTGRPLGEPDIISRGFVYERQAEDLLAMARDRLMQVLGSSESQTAEWSFLNTKTKETLGKFFYEQTHRHPMILPVVTEV